VKDYIVSHCFDPYFIKTYKVRHLNKKRWEVCTLSRVVGIDIPFFDAVELVGRNLKNHLVSGVGSK